MMFKVYYSFLTKKSLVSCQLSVVFSYLCGKIFTAVLAHNSMLRAHNKENYDTKPTIQTCREEVSLDVHIDNESVRSLGLRQRHHKSYGGCFSDSDGAICRQGFFSAVGFLRWLCDNGYPRSSLRKAL